MVCGVGLPLSGSATARRRPRRWPSSWSRPAPCRAPARPLCEAAMDRLHAVGRGREVERVGRRHDADQDQHDQAHALLAVVRAVGEAHAGAGQDQQAADPERRRRLAFGRLVERRIPRSRPWPPAAAGLRRRSRPAARRAAPLPMSCSLAPVHAFAELLPARRAASSPGRRRRSSRSACASSRPAGRDTRCRRSR